jgi:hypothetical protein
MYIYPSDDLSTFPQVASHSLLRSTGGQHCCGIEFVSDADRSRDVPHDGKAVHHHYVLVAIALGLACHRFARGSLSSR